ncbi:tRNA dimethylallyltransferase [Dissulfuribacter thermophilus]|uniref:tRNA dimethylallyltransferase n=1 Tax=Dissulfuribacter thermophilus TaxID=1156395 RepID=A0A1B9F5N7_9BACT|nr:tRNA (adenosine(37)-N6)-dimethylallyltransferase MiaA [Dissulfuribacter thermophilus]OCC15154.1 tRNA dimethylallyltransferase [Dissulfuribacter thermophilus]
MNKKLVKFPWIAILGPTAVGKTDFSLNLADEIRGEIINFDSVQIYKYLDIGSAKPTIEERKRVPHHLIDILYPDDPFDAADFIEAALKISKKLETHGKVPIFVGGTGFYLRALVEGLTPLPKGNPPLRNWLRSLESRFGRGFLFRCLSQFDPDTAKRLAKNDYFRIIRALEVFILTGQPFSKICRENRPFPRRFDCLVKIGLIRPRDELYNRIEQRVEQMFEMGFLEEVKAILEMGYSPNLKPLQSLGYRQVIDYILGKKSLERAIYEIKRDTRHYAKRQLTWFRRDSQIKWFHPDAFLGRADLWRFING